MDTKDVAQDRMGRLSTAGVAMPSRSAGGAPASVVRLPSGAVFGRQLAELRQGSGTRPADASTPAATAKAAPAAEPGSALVDQPREVTVQRGDTLTSLVRAQWVARGGAREALSPQEAHRWAMQVARENGLSDPDRIRVGQTLVVGAPPSGRATAPDRALAAAPSSPPPPSPLSSPATSGAASAPVSIVRVDALATAARLDNPLLTQTLDRAVDLGYVPPADRVPVSERIEALASKFGFKPDDFAKAVLMESDGLNPRASNGRCHGIIQFCSGPDRGAASAGYAQRPQEILNLSVLQQLDLVDRYFDDTKLREFRGKDGRVRLDDLYLTILTPAARQERSLNAPLPIAGPQALDLHVRRERHAPITRSSILAGLNVNAKARLGQFMVADLSAR